MRVRVVGGPFSPVDALPAHAFSLTSAPNAGGSIWTPPRALHLPTNETLLGWVDGSGNIECALFDETSSTLGTIRTIHAAFEDDAHDSPSFVRRASDGRLIVAYSRHNSTPFNIRVSTNPDDPSAWGSATNLDSQLGGTRYTDQQFWQLDDGTLWMIYRDEPSAGTDSRWCFSTCDPSTPTSGWAAQTIMYRVASQRSYVTSFSTGTRIHFVATNGGSTGGGYSGFTALFHWYWEGGSWFQTDGTSMGSPPFDFTDATEAYVGTGSVFMTNVSVDEDGDPLFAVGEIITGSPHETYVRWDGSSWNSTVVTASGVGYQYNAGGAFQSYGSCIDYTDPNAMWVIKDVSSQPELWLYQTVDDGASFVGDQITFGSSALQITPVPVLGASDSLRAYWQVGSWTNYDNWNQGLMGVGI